MTADPPTEYLAPVRRYLRCLLIDASIEDQTAFRQLLLPSETVPILISYLADCAQKMFNSIGGSLSRDCTIVEKCLLPTVNVLAFGHAHGALQLRRAAQTREQLVL